MGSKQNIAKRIQQKKAKQSQARARAKKEQIRKQQISSTKKTELLKKLASQIKYSPLALYAPYHAFVTHDCIDGVVAIYESGQVSQEFEGFTYTQRVIAESDKNVYIDFDLKTNNYVIGYDKDDASVNSMMLAVARCAVYKLMRFKQFITECCHKQNIDPELFHNSFYDVSPINPDYRFVGTDDVKYFTYPDSLKTQYRYRDFRTLIPEFLIWLKTKFHVNYKDIKNNDTVNIVDDQYTIKINQVDGCYQLNHAVDFTKKEILFTAPTDVLPGELFEGLYDAVANIYPKAAIDYLNEEISILLSNFSDIFEKTIKAKNNSNIRVNLRLVQRFSSDLYFVPVKFDVENTSIDISYHAINLPKNVLLRFVKQAIYFAGFKLDPVDTLYLLDEEIGDYIEFLQEATENHESKEVKNFYYDQIYNAAEMIYYLHILGVIDFKIEELVFFPNIIKALYIPSVDGLLNIDLSAYNDNLSNEDIRSKETSLIKRFASTSRAYKENLEVTGDEEHLNNSDVQKVSISNMNGEDTGIDSDNDAYIDDLDFENLEDMQKVLNLRNCKIS